MHIWLDNLKRLYSEINNYIGQTYSRMKKCKFELKVDP